MTQPIVVRYIEGKDHNGNESGLTRWGFITKETMMLLEQMHKLIREVADGERYSKEMKEQKDKIEILANTNVTVYLGDGRVGDGPLCNLSIVPSFAMNEEMTLQNTPMMPCLGSVQNEIIDIDNFKNDKNQEN